MSVAETLTPPQAPATAPDIVIDCDVKKIMYGSFLAVRDSVVPIERGKDHRLHRAVGMRQEHSVAQPQPHERSHQGLPP